MQTITCCSYWRAVQSLLSCWVIFIFVVREKRLFAVRVFVEFVVVLSDKLMLGSFTFLLIQHKRRNLAGCLSWGDHNTPHKGENAKTNTGCMVIQYDNSRAFCVLHAESQALQHLLHILCIVCWNENEISWSYRITLQRGYRGTKIHWAAQKRMFKEPRAKSALSGSFYEGKQHLSALPSQHKRRRGERKEDEQRILNFGVEQNMSGMANDLMVNMLFFLIYFFITLHFFASLFLTGQYLRMKTWSSKMIHPRWR